MLFTEQHEELRNSVRRFVAAEINPYVEEWEEAGAFPAHEYGQARFPRHQ